MAGPDKLPEKGRRPGNRKTLRLTWPQATEAVSRAFESLRTGSREVTHRPAFVRDAISVRRIAAVYLVALLPCLLLGTYNTGLQIDLAAASGLAPLENWRTGLVAALGHVPGEAGGFGIRSLHGLLYFLPLAVGAWLATRGVELAFALIRREQLGPGSWVLALVFALMLPPATPVWQAMLAMAFGVIMGKEVFGGTGRNLVHPVLLAWAFLFVTYPETLSGDAIWVPVDGERAAWLHQVSASGSPVLADLEWTTAFLGFTPGAFGETSALACFLGAAWLLLARVVSWRVVLGFVAGSVLASAGFAAGDPGSNPLFGIPVHWQLVLGGWAFGMAFLVTDSVTGAHTNPGRWVYGLIAGAFVVFVRVLNPTQLDGTAIALLFMNLFAPLIDYWFVAANVRRRRARNEAQ